MSAVSLRNLSFCYLSNAEPCLSDINLEIPLGQVHTLLGAGSSGKTTFLKLIVGLLIPTQGAVYFQAENIHQLNPKRLKAFRRSIGMSFQRGGLLDAFNVEGNLRFILEESDQVSPQNIAEIVEKALSDVGLWESRKLYPCDLSGGMQKRLSLAKSLVLKPKFLLMDEPTAGLDPVNANRVMDLIEKFSVTSERMTLIATTDIVVAERFSQNTHFLAQKKIIASGTLKDIQTTQLDPIRQYFATIGGNGG